jgi:hypothetical protein
MDARALSRTGDVAACEAALNAATKALESRNSEDEPEWISYVDEAELTEVRAMHQLPRRIPPEPDHGRPQCSSA